MKLLLMTLSVFVLLACKPEQESTTFNVAVAPQVGANVQTSTLEEQPVLVEYEVEKTKKSTDLTFDLVEKPRYGILKDCKYLTKTKWQCFYIPNKDFNGIDRLAFKTRDGDFTSKDKAYLEIQVGPVNDAPEVGDDQEYTLVENTTKDFDIREAKDVDNPKNDLLYVVVDGPENGILENCFGDYGLTKCKYVPTAEYYGKDKFTYKVKDRDGLESKDVATVYFNILKERIPVAGTSSIKLEDKKSNALIVFALDISNSMDPYLDHMKKSVANFVDDIATRGFKATIVFIDSDDKTTWLTTTEDHGTYPKETGAKIVHKQKIPLPERIKIFEIDAYDYDWNQATKDTVATTKTQIDTFIDSLPDGSNDERLLCSAVRFLHSEHADGKDYVGLFALANEDDAVKAIDLKAAHAACIKEEVIEYVPKESCSKTVSCNYGDAGCNGKFTYYYQEPYVQVTKSYNNGTCDYQKKIYRTEQRTRAKGYLVKPKYVYKDVTECKETWKDADNPSGCREVRKQVQDGTYNQNVDWVGTCVQHSQIQNCTEYQQNYSVFDHYETAQKSCSYRGGECSDHPQVKNCVHTPEVRTNKTRNKTKQTALDQTCLEATGYDTCYQNRTWSGTKTYTTSEGCGVKSLAVVTKNFDVPNIKAEDQTLAKSLHHRMTDKYSKSVFVAVANDETLNAEALALATSKKIDLPSADCLDYATNRTIFEGMDGVQFKTVSDLMGDQGDFYSICFPEKYPSGKLDFLVEDAQLDYIIPEYAITDDLVINEVKLIYADGSSAELSKDDYSYNDGHIVLNDPLLAKNLVELQAKFEGYKK